MERDKGSRMNTNLTPEEAGVLLDRLRDTWIPSAGYRVHVSALEKLERIANRRITPEAVR